MARRCDTGTEVPPHAGHDAERVYGPDLTLALCERAASEGWSSFFYGAAPGVADTMASNLEQWFEGFTTAGTLSPPYRELTPEEVNLSYNNFYEFGSHKQIARAAEAL